MKITRFETGHRPVVHITLSRRNLIALLEKLDQPDSARTLLKDLPQANLILTSEEDEVHYQDAPSGDVHPATEARMAESVWRGRANVLNCA